MSDPRPPGWYPDPFGVHADDTRYWDGETWLASTPPPSSEASTDPRWQQDVAPTSTDRSDSWQQAGLPRDRVVTPDGVRLASWGRRLVAYLIDAIILGVVSLLVAAPTGVFDAFSAFAAAMSAATSDAAVTQAQEAFLAASAGPMLVISVFGILASAAYSIGFVAMRGATPGKMAAGIGVRLRDREGPPGLRAAAVRWLVQFGPGMLSSVPVISYVASIFQVIDGLWPIWDLKRQAIHDKAARTNVVVRRG